MRRTFQAITRAADVSSVMKRSTSAHANRSEVWKRRGALRFPHPETTKPAGAGFPNVP
jgi:hypothetical protein